MQRSFFPCGRGLFCAKTRLTAMADLCQVDECAKYNHYYGVHNPAPNSLTLQVSQNGQSCKQTKDGVQWRWTTSGPSIPARFAVCGNDVRRAVVTSSGGCTATTRSLARGRRGARLLQPPTTLEVTKYDKPPAMPIFKSKHPDIDGKMPNAAYM